jgi:hypothetical protein
MQLPEYWTYLNISAHFRPLYDICLLCFCHFMFHPVQLIMQKRKL